MGKIIENKILQIFIAILIPNLCAWIAFAILANKIAENESRDQIEPGYAPPGYVVGIAWTIIFTITGYGSWRVFNTGKNKRISVKIPLLFYTITLFLNILWTFIAFGLDLLLVAIIEMIILLIFVAITGLLFYKVDKLSGLFFIPYFVYLSYATVLCIHIYILNN